MVLSLYATACSTPRQRNVYLAKQLYGQQAKSVQVLPVQQQKGSVDCGCFTIAFAVSVVLGENPAHHIYNQTKMREYLVMCFEQGFFIPFPSMPKEKLVVVTVLLWT